MRPPRPSLTLWIVLGLLLGVLAGLVFGELCSALEPVADAFIRVWQITILPSVVVSLIVGIGSLKRDSARNIAVKAVLVLLLLWVIGTLAFFSFQLAFPVREAASFYSTQDPAGAVDTSMVDLFIPSNPFTALAQGWIPAIVIFCLFLGFALMLDDGSGPMLSSLRTVQGALFRMTRILSLTFPVGIFIITARTAGTLTLEGFLDLQVFLVSLAAAAVLLSLVVLPLMVTCVTTFRYRDVLSAASKAVLLALSTGTEFVTLPLIGEGVGKLFDGYADSGPESDADRAGEVRTYSEILVPVAYTFPLLGALSPFVFILFVAWLYQSPLGLWDQVKLVALGIPTFFGSSKLAVISLLDQMHLPADAYNLYVGTGFLRACFVAAMSAMSIFTFAVISIALATNRARLRWGRTALSVVLVLVLVGLVLVGLKTGFSDLLAGTYHGDDQISRIELPRDQNGLLPNESVNTTVYLRPEDVPATVGRESGGGDVGRRAVERGALRVGYNPNCIPFVFFNGKGDLVGYDVEMAYDLASVMNVSRIEFVPVTGDTLAELLDSGYCDIVMSSVVVTAERLGTMKFTDPYATVHMALVVPDGEKGEFTNLATVQKMDGLKVAVFNNTALARVATGLFPRAEIVPIESREEYFVERRADALFTAAEEGYPMTLLYPFFDVAVLEPIDAYPMMYAYPVARNSSETFLMTLNYWIRMENDYGMLKQKYDYWILGKIPGLTEPRWSVVRNVLHWVN